MLGEKDYVLVCHGCGKFHVVRAMFMSMPLATMFDDPDNSRKRWCVPNRGCDDCIGTGIIKTAYEKGMTPEARERANREFVEWLPRLRRDSGSLL
jgi:hypothetical protein